MQPKEVRRGKIASWAEFPLLQMTELEKRQKSAGGLKQVLKSCYESLHESSELRIHAAQF